MTHDELKNAAYAELTEQGYLPTSKTDRMAVVDIVVDAVEPLIRADERDRMQRQAASVVITRNDDGTLTYSVADPHEVGWVPVSLDLIPEMAANMRALADLRAKVEAMAGVHGIWLYREDVLALIDGSSDGVAR